jgi:hypothetical protein
MPRPLPVTMATLSFRYSPMVRFSFRDLALS